MFQLATKRSLIRFSIARHWRATTTSLLLLTVRADLRKLKMCHFRWRCKKTTLRLDLTAMLKRFLLDVRGSGCWSSDWSLCVKVSA